MKKWSIPGLTRNPSQSRNPDEARKPEGIRRPHGLKILWEIKSDFCMGNQGEYQGRILRKKKSKQVQIHPSIPSRYVG